MKTKTILTLLLVLILSSVCFGAAATMYVTVVGATTKTGASWATAMGLAEWQTDITNNAEAGDIYYVAGGTYTLTGAWSTAKAGTAVAPISIIGVKTGTTAAPPTASDYAYNADRPLIAAAANTFDFTGDYWVIRNLQVTTTAQYGFKVNSYNIVQNCYSFNSSATAAYHAFYSTGGTKYISCEGVSTKGRAILLYGFASAINCYCHDSATGIQIFSNGNSIIGNRINTCTIGMDFALYHSSSVINNTISGCTTGITGTTAYNNVFINNIISGCTTGANWTTANQKINWWDYNCWNNTTDVVNVTTGDHVLLATDPQFINVAGGDFRLKPSSPCLNTGMPTLDSGKVTMGAWRPYAIKETSSRQRYSGEDIYKQVIYVKRNNKGLII